MRKKSEMIGKRFGRLIVVSEEEPYVSLSGKRVLVYKCKCDCGNVKNVRGTHLRQGRVKSCGCLKAEQETHGNDRIAHIWMHMKNRCYNPKSTSYKNYGARGITICDEWINDFFAFKKWALENGYNDKLSIDRIDNNGGYEPTNCKWSSDVEQGRNRRNTIMLSCDGETRPLTEWAEITGINQKTLRNRKYLGWTDEEILRTPVSMAR